MKTREEPNALENEVIAPNTKPEGLTDQELTQVSGGINEGRYFVYVIRKGDSLAVIAMKYETTVEILCEVNSIRNPNVIYPGNKLLIPYKG